MFQVHHLLAKLDKLGKETTPTVEERTVQNWYQNSVFKVQSGFHHIALRGAWYLEGVGLAVVCEDLLFRFPNTTLYCNVT